MSTREQTAQPPSSERDSEGGYAFALHEVSNALTVVLGWLDLGARADSEVEVRRALEVAREHAKRGQILARRAIGAEVESSRGGRSGRELAEFVSISLEPTALERQVVLDLQVSAGTDGTVNDEAGLVQVLTNLLLNAIQFSPSGGIVSLGVARDADELRFSIIDQGPGIAPAQREHLFSRPVTTRAGGAGLGLAHSRALARARGGDLRHIPSVHGGAHFEVAWPVARATGVRPSSRTRPIDVLSGARILLIEDDLAVASLVELSCEARGAEVVGVHDSDELSAVLAAHPLFDIVLMDLSPVAGHLTETLDQLQQLVPDAQLVLMSGHPNGVPAAGEGRFATWVRKPFDMDQLIQSVADLLRSRA